MLNHLILTVALPFSFHINVPKTIDLSAFFAPRSVVSYEEVYRRQA